MQAGVVHGWRGMSGVEEVEFFIQWYFIVSVVAAAGSEVSGPCHWWVVLSSEVAKE